MSREVCGTRVLASGGEHDQRVLVVLEEAREGYAEEIVVVLKSESTEDLESNVERIVQWINNWIANNQS